MFSVDQFDISNNGGFVNDDNQGSTAKKKQQVRRMQSVVPLFISHILECTDEEFNLYGMPVHFADVVGVLKDFEVQTTKATCTIEDHSASIKAIMWLETDNDTVTALPPVKENCYVRVFGSVRTQDGEKMIMILKILPVDDLNIVTNHLLEIIQAKLYAERLADGRLPAANLSTTVATTSTSAAANNSSGLKPMQVKIINLLKPIKSRTGLSRSEIMQHFGAQAREAEVALDFLLDEGHVYTTVDTDHYKATDAD
ncbi:replication protein A2 [Tribolium castaneum]|uniref:Replication protein A 32 kDa subunit-like Protein n=1 Tax=Tribolium castaneum TaxID=7070 RepID=D6WX21_TRICA|nr:replication protein A2 [Tribolium castaneum]EFA09169.1 Replication protein A 32 kDa subunit-like Protein [Tribolium castaneum]|eukprot:NP_001164201.1 replication protein A2 [Tribolium castaneum]